MAQRFIISLFICLILFSFAGDLYARAVARWIGPFAAASAHTRVFGVPFCDSTVVYPFHTPNLPIQAFCQSVRDPWWHGGAFAYAICDTLMDGRKYASAWAYAWGQHAWAGKSIEDTTRCSTAVYSTIIGGILDIDFYGAVSSTDSKQMAILTLSVTSRGDTLFNGRAEFNGDSLEVNADGGFINDDFVQNGSIYEIDRSFTGIDVSIYHPDSVQIEATADTRSYMPVSSTTPYGLIILIALITISAGYLLFRRRKYICYK
ncbi:MAG: hypothetical protein KAR42_16340 [candidate division Zixibacteria bacterium]|nr:hypothetical protein [candidate division Zixibacteria bacterium]